MATAETKMVRLSTRRPRRMPGSPSGCWNGASRAGGRLPPRPKSRPRWSTRRRRPDEAVRSRGRRPARARREGGDGWLVPRSPSQTSPSLERDMVARYGLRKFVQLAWPQVEPGRFLSNWHVDLICEHLEALHRLEIRNLLIEVPPGCMKSLIVAVFFPAWVWTRDPGHKFIFATYAQDLSDRDAKRHRDPWRRRGSSRDGATDARSALGSFSRSACSRPRRRAFASPRRSVALPQAATRTCSSSMTRTGFRTRTPAAKARARRSMRRTRSGGVGIDPSRRPDDDARNIVIAQRLHDADVPGGSRRKATNSCASPYAIRPEGDVGAARKRPANGTRRPCSQPGSASRRTTWMTPAQARPAPRVSATSAGSDPRVGLALLAGRLRYWQRMPDLTGTRS